MPIEITVRDTDTGETTTKTITNDHILICAGTHYLHYRQWFARSGTVQYTVKVDRSVPTPDATP